MNMLSAFSNTDTNICKKNLIEAGFVTDHYNGAIRVMVNPNCQAYQKVVLNEVTNEVSYWRNW